MAVAAAARPAWFRPMNTLTCTRLVSGIARSPAVCPAVCPASGAVLRTTSRALCPAGIAAALLTPLISSVDAAATDRADVVSILWAGISFPLLGPHEVGLNRTWPIAPVYAQKILQRYWFLENPTK